MWKLIISICYCSQRHAAPSRATLTQPTKRAYNQTHSVSMANSASRAIGITSSNDYTSTTPAKVLKQVVDPPPISHPMFDGTHGEDDDRGDDGLDSLSARRGANAARCLPPLAHLRTDVLLARTSSRSHLHAPDRPGRLRVAACRRVRVDFGYNYAARHPQQEAEDRAPHRFLDARTSVCSTVLSLQ